MNPLKAGRTFPTARRFAGMLSRHPEWVGYVGLVSALLALLLHLGSWNEFAQARWVSSDSLWPVNVFVDLIRDHYSISGWRFSIAPFWFPDLFVTGVFWLLTRNPILATFLAGFLQMFAIVAAFHLMARAIGMTKLFLQDTVLLACSTALTLYVADRPAVNYPNFPMLLLPEGHVGNMLLVLFGWGMALLMIRDKRQGIAPRAWLIFVYAAMCLLAGMSNLFFFPHMLVPLTVALAFAMFLGFMTIRQCWLPVLVGWLAAMLGAILNRVLFTTASVSVQSQVALGPILTSMDVFVRGFGAKLLSGDALHIVALVWASICVANIAWFIRRAALRGVSATLELERFRTLFFVMCLTASMLSVAAIVLGGSSSLAVLKDYEWSMHYLHQTFFLPLFGLPMYVVWVIETVLNGRELRIFAWTLALLMLYVATMVVITAPRPATPIYAYRPSFVRFLDQIAREKNLHYGFAGYWQARLITLLSKSGIRAYAVNVDMSPYLWANNARWYDQSLENRSRQPRLSFVVLDDPVFRLTREDAVRAFGQPAEEMQDQGTRILIYKETADATDLWKAVAANLPLPSFSEDVQSSVKSLSLHRAETTLVPVTLRNTGPALWSTIGKLPVNISYKWFDHGALLPIEGERTRLPRPMKPGDSVDVQVKVVAPDRTGDLILKVSLVQEGVAWFMSAGARPLELPVTVR